MSFLSTVFEHAAAVFAAAAILGCGGQEFASCQEGCGEDAAASSAGGSSARDATGGASGARGGAGGGAQDGSSAGAAGAAGANEGGTDSDAAPQFPRTPVLDAFERADGELGLNWLGNTAAYRIANRRLEYRSGPGSAVLWHAPFGPEQEVFATLSAIGAMEPEINVVLKAQELTDCELFEVMYAPDQRQLQFNYCTDSQWHEMSTLPLQLKPGDQLGARARSGGRLDVFVNGVLATSLDISEFPHHAKGGRIGVNCLPTGAGAALAWDDFGGG